MNLKKTLKTIKLNESTISMVLGAIIIVVVGLLVINYFRKTETGKTLPVSETQQQDATPTVGQTHTVKSGETLWSIAEAAYGSGYNWVDLAQANNLNNPDDIQAGEKIEIPDVTPKTATIQGQAAEELISADAISATTYKVVKGDNLWTIAVRAYGDGYKWVEIARENKLDNPNIIHSGNTLVLPK